MIYFVRHGLSESNVKRIFAGQKDDSLLTEQGKEEARRIGREILKECIFIDKIVSSPAKRAVETAQLIANEIKIDPSKIIFDKRINDYDMGDLAGTPWRSIASSELIKVKGAEDINNFYNRVYSCLKDLSNLEGNILIVSHGSVGRILESIKEKKDISLFYDLPIYSNTIINKIDWI